MSKFDGETMTDAELKKLAQSRVKTKMHFLGAVIAYVLFNFFIVLIWLGASSHDDDFWPGWVMLGTGLFLLIYGIFVWFELTNVSSVSRVDAEYNRLKQAAGYATPEKKSDKN